MASTPRQLILVPLDDAEYDEFAEGQVAEYALQHVNAGEWTAEEAPQRAREELTEMLSDMLRRAGHDFLKAIEGSETAVGWVWVAPAPEFPRSEP